MFICLHSQNLAAGVSLSDFAYSFSPLVEKTADDTVVIDVEGCDLLFGSPYQLANEVTTRALLSKEAGGLGSKINVALAGNPDAAIYAAWFFEGITFISPGEELTCLGDLSIEVLVSPKSKVQSPKSKNPKSTLDFGLWTLDLHLDFGFWTLDFLETMRLWGIKTFRDFADLPTTGVSERLGQLGVELQQLARGKKERQLKLRQPAPVFESSLILDYPLRELEPLSFILARLLNQLCANLEGYALATNELRLLLKLEHGTLHERKLTLPTPSRDHKIFLKLLLLDIEMHSPQSAVVAVSIACEPVKPRVIQSGLFIPLAPEPQKLELTLARIAKLVGAENIGSPELINTHRPDAFRLKRFCVPVSQRLRVSSSPPDPLSSILGFRVFRPPLRAMVEAARGYPSQISAWGRNASVHGKVVQLAGPWRTTGNWWRNDRWARDEWDVAVAGRSQMEVFYRIYRNLSEGSWFVEGVYD